MPEDVTLDKRFRVGLKAVWQDEAPWTNTDGRLRHRNTKYDFGGEFQLTSRMSFYFQGRNVFETPHRVFEERDGNERALQLGTPETLQTTRHSTLGARASGLAHIGCLVS